MVELEQELVKVTAVSSSTLTVIRGVLGTTAAAHVDNTVATVNPEFTRKDALDLINECLRDLYPELFQVSTLALTYSTTLVGLDASGHSGGYPLAVMAQRVSASKLWEPVADWRFETNMPTTEFASGKALMLRASLDSGASIQVIYPAPFTDLAAETEDLVTDAGMQAYMEDLPYFYILGYTLPAREAVRSQIQAAQAHQRAADVPGFLALRTGEWYLSRYDEKKKLAKQRQMEEVRRVRMTGYGS